MPDSDKLRCEQCGAPLGRHTREGLCSRCIARFCLLEPEVGEREPVTSDPLSVISAEGGGRTPKTGFGDYELLEEIAHGGMGVVYRARQKSLNRIVAVKMVLFGQFAGKTAFERFRAEAQTVARLQHPNIVAIHEIGETDGQPYFSMDYVAGRNLADLVRDRPLLARQAAGYVCKIAQAVQYAHTQGVLHRDLKPANVLIDESDEPRITDFGLARQMAGDSELTLTGQVIGSPNFMPPEQGAGKQVKLGPASDVYGLGAVLYCLLTARPPFVAETFEATLAQVLNTEPVAPRQLNPGIPRDLETLCLKCLEKDPERRCASAGELADELDRFLKGEPIHARPLGPADKLWRWCRRKPVLAALAAAVLALAAISTTTAVRMTVAQGGRERELYRANIQLADAHIQKGDIDQALESLLQCPPRLRHWEWGYLVGECHREVLALDQARAPLTNVVFGPTPPEWNCGFSLDGRRVGTIHPSGIAQVWELPSGKPVWSLRLTNEIVAGMVWLADWSGVALARSNTVEIIPLASSTRRLKLDGHAHQIRRLAVSPVGQRVAALAADNTLRIWDSASGQPLAVFPVIAGGQRLFFTGDGRRLVVAAQEQAAAYDVDTGEVLVRMAGGVEDAVAVLPDPEAERFVTVSGGARLIGHRFQLRTTNGLVRDLGFLPNPKFREVVFSPDRRSFCTSGTEATAAVRDSQTGDVIMTIPGRVNSGTFSPDGQRLATRGGTSVIQIWDLAKRRELLKLKGHREAVHDVAFSPDGRLLASVSKDGSVKVWSALPGREIFDCTGLPWGLSYTPDSRRLAYAFLPDWIAIRDTQSGRLDASLRRLHRVCLTVAFRPDGRQLATSDGFGETAIWEVETGRLLRVLRGHGHGIDRVLYSRDGRRLITGSYDGTVRLWDPDSGQQLRVLARVPNLVDSLDLSPDGRRIVVADGEVGRVWNVETGQREHDLRGGSGYVHCALFTPDGARVATTSSDRTLRLWDARSGQSLACWNLRGIAGTFGFSPDGQRVALRVSQGAVYATDAPTVEIRDVQTGHQLLTFRGFMEMGNISGFSPDGRRLVTDWWDSKVRQWEAFPWTEAEYPGSPARPLRERMRLYADQYWRERLEAERQAADTNGTINVELPFDRSQIPARGPAAPPNLIDLTAHYTGTLNESSYLASHGDYMGIDLRNAPMGLARFQDVPFDLRGVIQLAPALDDFGLWEGYPQAVRQIPVPQRFRTLHAIIGSIGSAPEGKAIGALVLRYADGTRHECEIIYGRHLRHWWTHGDSRTDTDLAQVAWEGPHAFPNIHPTRLRIYHSTWENPRPGEEVVSFDFVSRMTTTAAPFLIAVTVE